jgi:hypothetical protein
MLARRFTIVCLMLMLFGMLLSVLVAKASRLPHSWEEEATGCIFGDDANCLRARTR